MRLIALEEHFTSKSLWEANASHPLVQHLKRLERDAAEIGHGAAVSPDLSHRLFDLGEERIAIMDDAGIDVQVLSQTTPGTETLEPGLAADLAIDANDTVAQAVAAHPDRFAAFATLASPNPRAAADELSRSVNELGFVGGMVNGHVGGRYLDDQFFWPIFEAAESLSVPIYIHPTPAPQPVIDAIYTGFSPGVNAALATGGWGWHIDTGYHFLRLILAGVFDQFPNLQIILGHMGEILPAMIWRVDRIFNDIAGLKRPVREYVEEHAYFSTSGIFDEIPFTAALKTVGSDRMLFAVDYPYSGNDEARAFFDGLEIEAEVRESIAHRNAERLLRLGERSSA